MPATHVGQGFRAWALFRDGSRLATGSPVMIAGVRVGEVTIARDRRRHGARRHEARRRRRRSRADSWITKKAESAFGDSYLEIIPTGGDEGAPTGAHAEVGRAHHPRDRGLVDGYARCARSRRRCRRSTTGLNAMHDVALTGRNWVHGHARGAHRRHRSLARRGPHRAAARRRRSRDGAARDRHDDAPPTRSTSADVNEISSIRSTRPSRARASRWRRCKTGLHDGLATARDGMDRVDPQIDAGRSRHDERDQRGQRRGLEGHARPHRQQAAARR